MSGKPKIKTYNYTQEGKYIGKYNSFSEVRKDFYNDTKYPLFNTRREELPEIHFLPDNTVLVKERVGRQGILEFIKICNSNLLIKPKYDKRRIGMFNLQHKLIADFASIRIASLILNVHVNVITTSINSNKKRLQIKDYYFKYLT